METLIKEKLVKRIDLSGRTFDLLRVLLAFICFRYEHLDVHLHTHHRLRASPMYIASGREKDIHKYDVIRYPWLSTNHTLYATGIPPHAI